MVFTNSILPHSPYADASGAVLQVWRPSHWASWMFEIASYNGLNASAQEFIFSKGGFQGGGTNSSAFK